jgi:hypothetical protein
MDAAEGKVEVLRTSPVMDSILANLRPGLDEKVQEELSRLIILIPDVKTDYLLTSEVELAAKALLLEPPNLPLAIQIRENIEKKAKRLRNPLSALFFGGSPPTKVILGMGALLYLAIPLIILYFPRITATKEFLGLDIALVMLVGLSGAMGSIVSIMVRINTFRKYIGDPSILFFTGFFKPVIGMAFAIFVFAILKSGILPVTVDTSKELYLFMALGFIAGFSERFARDIMGKAEKAVGGERQED